MGQQQGKASKKQNKKKSGLKHGKEAKQKHKKTGKISKKKQKELSLKQQVEPVVSVKEELNKEEIIQQSIDTFGESQVEIHSAAEQVVNDKQRNQEFAVDSLANYRRDENYSRSYTEQDVNDRQRIKEFAVDAKGDYRRDENYSRSYTEKDVNDRQRNKEFVDTLTDYQQDKTYYRSYSDDLDSSFDETELETEAFHFNEGILQEGGIDIDNTEVLHGRPEQYGKNHQYKYANHQGIENIQEGSLCGEYVNQKALRKSKYASPSEQSSRISNDIVDWVEQSQGVKHGRGWEEQSTPNSESMIKRSQEIFTEQANKPVIHTLHDSTAQKAHKFLDLLINNSFEHQTIETSDKQDKQSDLQNYQGAHETQDEEPVEQHEDHGFHLPLKDNISQRQRYQKTASHKNWRTSPSKQGKVSTKKKEIVLFLLL